MPRLTGLLLAHVASSRPLAAGGEGVYYYSHGHCGVTDYKRMDCEADDAGAWPLSRAQAESWRNATHTCARRCEGCARCRYISVSLKFADCSWYAECNMSRLSKRPPFFRTLPVEPRRDIPEIASMPMPPGLAAIDLSAARATHEGLALHRPPDALAPPGADGCAMEHICRRCVARVGCAFCVRRQLATDIQGCFNSTRFAGFCPQGPRMAPDGSLRGFHRAMCARSSTYAAAPQSAPPPRTGDEEGARENISLLDSFSKSPEVTTSYRPRATQLARMAAARGDQIHAVPDVEACAARKCTHERLRCRLPLLPWLMRYPRGQHSGHIYTADSFPRYTRRAPTLNGRLRPPRTLARLPPSASALRPSRRACRACRMQVRRSRQARGAACVVVQFYGARQRPRALH